MKTTAKPIENLINQLNKLPGIGSKTAQRLAYFIIDMKESEVKNLSESIIDAKLNVKECSICSNFTDEDPCKICSSSKRDNSIICVMEYPKDVEAMERTRCYNGLYHVLHGTISPQKGVGPNDLKIRELLKRLEDDSVKEIIIATNPTVEGDTTALYISKITVPLGIKTTRIAYGIPVGGDLEYYDEITISTALNNRRELK
ncbi:DNA replication and repair protein RecR [Anaerosphaera aminiphila DSM 21120]|uniref:Recombination protein RecR n=1 Tax=Anaerosphaera aminiphila DSM 21120 TaxID=1120995 RepID=A0A1M5PDB8_9FIRM|nr:recombination mediator RecR [Anaerosphaera aminiphila]SHG99794.1 DNA replication and repair protein RecR [Anaerosphaera aminiphila DSM 21120]